MYIDDKFWNMRVGWSLWHVKRDRCLVAIREFEEDQGRKASREALL
jgi:hypothetical protein